MKRREAYLTESIRFHTELLKLLCIALIGTIAGVIALLFEDLDAVRVTLIYIGLASIGLLSGFALYLYITTSRLLNQIGDGTSV